MFDLHSKVTIQKKVICSNVRFTLSSPGLKSLHHTIWPSTLKSHHSKGSVLLKLLDVHLVLPAWKASITQNGQVHSKVTIQREVFCSNLRHTLSPPGLKSLHHTNWPSTLKSHHSKGSFLLKFLDLHLVLPAWKAFITQNGRIHWKVTIQREVFCSNVRFTLSSPGLKSLHHAKWPSTLKSHHSKGSYLLKCSIYT